MSGEGHREVVKVRLRSNVYTSKAMPQADAVAARDGLRKRVAEERDGWGFVEFTDRHGREVSLRARDVTVIEVGIALEDDEAFGRGRAGRRYGAGAEVNVDGSPRGPVGGADDGMTFLREQQQRARERLHPAGRQR